MIFETAIQRRAVGTDPGVKAITKNLMIKNRIFKAAIQGQARKSPASPGVEATVTLLIENLMFKLAIPHNNAAVAGLTSPGVKVEAAV
jgi:hypothetical protein